MGAVFGALPGNSNVESLEDQKRGQKSQGDELVLEAVISAPKGGDVAIDQCQTSMVPGDDANAQVVSTEQNVLQLPSVPIDRKEKIGESENVHVLPDKNAAVSESFSAAADITGNLVDTGDVNVIIYTSFTFYLYFSGFSIVKKCPHL